MELKIRPARGLRGELTVPGDKSISHRAVILGALAEGRTAIKGFLESSDCLRTVEACRLLGAAVRRKGPGEYIIDGVGLNGLSEPDEVIDCGNSGTTMRLLAGLLAARPFYSVLSGDSSLRRRPMDRVIQPLQSMGAEIWARKGGYAPLSIKGGRLQGMSYALPVASAQLKSSLLLAGISSGQRMELVEPGMSRDHTELMLQSFGVPLEKEGRRICLSGGSYRLYGQELEIPGDISSAAFLIAAALLTEGSEVLLKNVGVNPSRSGFLEVVQEMGGEISMQNRRESGGEPTADLLVRSSRLRGTAVGGGIIPRLIDELPIIAVLASRAEGETVIRDAAELRVKETDRIRAVVANLTKLGVNIREREDGMVIKGPAVLQGGVVLDPYGDHRMVMSLAVAGLVAGGELMIRESQSLNTSFPEFPSLLESLVPGQGKIRVVQGRH